MRTAINAKRNKKSHTHEQFQTGVADRKQWILSIFVNETPLIQNDRPNKKRKKAHGVADVLLFSIKANDWRAQYDQPGGLG
jgi:hypothetical protein